MSDFLPDELKAYIKYELEPAPNKDFYICPICGSGTGKGKGKADGALKVYDDNSWHCFSCNRGGDIINLVEERDNLNPWEARRYVMEKYGNKYVDKNTTSIGTSKREKYITESAGNISGTDGERYLTNRGFSLDTIKKYRLGYVSVKREIVIPYPGTDYYVTRSIIDKEYRKPKGIPEPIFNEIAINERDTIFICEGQLDALSLLQLGVKAIAIGGAGYSKLESAKIKRAIIVKDNDDAGEQTAQKIKETLKKRGINCVIVAPPENYKDINDVLIANEEQLKNLVAEWLKQIETDNVSEYLQGMFQKELENFQKYKNKKTGYSNIDKITNLYPGLYVIGAISSLGKTTFAHQMGDQLASIGEHVLYFSLEQNRLEMVTKGLSRLTAQADINNAVSAIDIRRGYNSRAVTEAIKKYIEIAKNESIIECGFDTTVIDITNKVKDYIKSTGSKPIVIVDYLQIIRPMDTKQSMKDAVDIHVRALKKLQSENNLVVFVISSLNRQNYLSPVDFESFKESGGIEYTADVIWGLQLQVMTEAVFDKKDGLKEKREAIKKAKLEIPRKVELVCLKNRYGRSSYNCSFNYFPQYDLFIPDDEFMPVFDEDAKENPWRM